jgi:hypothetical protein
MLTKYAFPLTFVFVDDGMEPRGYAALACEIRAASDGRDLTAARQMIQDAVAVLVSYEIEEGDIARVARPITNEDLTEFTGEATADRLVVEYHTLLVAVETEPHPRVASAEFVPSAVTPWCYPPRVAA